MFHWVVDSLAGYPRGRRVFVVLEEHQREHKIADLIAQVAGKEAIVVEIPDVTEGQLCTVIEARTHLDPDDDLLVSPCDTVVISSLAAELRARPSDVEGIISVADLPGDRWSFARCDADGRVVEVAEKIRISDHASTGLYHFASTARFLDVAGQMIADDARTKGEFYVIPVYERYVARGWEVRLSHASRVLDLGTEEAIAEAEASGLL